MDHFPVDELSLKEKLAFRHFLFNSLCDRLPVLAQTLAFFQVWMLSKDLIRYIQGTLLVDNSHRHLLYAHLTLFAFWPFLQQLHRRQALIRSGQYPAVRYWLMGVFYCSTYRRFIIRYWPTVTVVR